MNNIPLIFDIQRSSFEDGAGIRTVVFFKGCPLKCAWCHNPESQSVKKEVLWHEDLCKNCNSCYWVCQDNAIRIGGYDYKIDRTKCNTCGYCTNACDYNAIKIAGQNYTIETLKNILLKDKTYYTISGGGVTFSGGEPLMFIEFLSDICCELKKENIDIAVQTCGYFNFDEFEKHLSPYINTIYFDLKIANDKMHIQYTSKSNALILDNLTKLFSPKKHKIIIRTPLIDGIIDTPENLAGIKEIISNLDYDRYEKLIFNDSFCKKLIALGRNINISIGR